LVSTSVVRQKVDLRRTFYFDTRIHPEVRGFINLFSICACSPVRFATIRAKWKTGLIFASGSYRKTSCQFIEPWYYYGGQNTRFCHTPCSFVLTTQSKTIEKGLELTSNRSNLASLFGVLAPDIYIWSSLTLVRGN
jgi:hypothetical protein